MRKVFYLILLVGLLYNCESNDDKNNESDKNEMEETLTHSETIKEEDAVHFNLFDVRKYALAYDPSHIDLSKDINDTLKYRNLKNIFAHASEDSLLPVSKIFLLKLNLYHLQRANQGYDLYTMRNGGAKIIIDYYLTQNKLDTVGEFMNSGYVYELESKKVQHDTIMQNLMNKIEKEINRINDESQKTIEKHE